MTLLETLKMIFADCPSDFAREFDLSMRGDF